MIKGFPKEGNNRLVDKGLDKYREHNILKKEGQKLGEVRDLLKKSGYSDKAIEYYEKRVNVGDIKTLLPISLIQARVVIRWRSF